jgi:F-type H+-transporting ATPase subunit delta
VRYAKALYDLSVEQNAAKEVYDHSKIVSEIIESSADLYSILHNPVILPSEKEKLISKVFTGKVNPMLSSFIVLMVKKRRESYIKNALLVFRKMYREKQGIVSVVIESPMQPSEDLINRVLTFVKTKFDKTPQLEIKIIPELIGGFIVEVEGLLLDLSISGQLAKVRKTLVQDQKEF